MTNIIIKLIMSMGIKNAVSLLLKLAKIIVQKTANTTDDQIVNTLIQIWQQLQTVVPDSVIKAKQKK